MPSLAIMGCAAMGSSLITFLHLLFHTCSAKLCMVRRGQLIVSSFKPASKTLCRGEASMKLQRRVNSVS